MLARSSEKPHEALARPHPQRMARSPTPAPQPLSQTQAPFTEAGKRPQGLGNQAGAGMSAGYAFGGEKARALQGIVRERIKDGLAQLVADGQPIHEAGASLGLTKGQTARAWGQIKADCGDQAC